MSQFITIGHGVSPFPASGQARSINSGICLVARHDATDTPASKTIADAGGTIRTPRLHNASAARDISRFQRHHQVKQYSRSSLWSMWPSRPTHPRSEEHTSELQSLMRISYAVFCLK